MARLQERGDQATSQSTRVWPEKWMNKTKFVTSANNLLNVFDRVPDSLRLSIGLTEWFRTSMDHLWMAFCVFWVHCTILFYQVPVFGEALRRLTMMSGSGDTNANLCLFLRSLYAQIPNEEAAFDREELVIGSIFLEFQYRIALKLVQTFGLRVLPPPLRPLYISYYGRACSARDFVENAVHDPSVTQLVILGAGFDTSAYRTHRKRRTTAENPAVHRSSALTVFEVDLPHVQLAKLDIMRKRLTPSTFENFTKDVKYLPCNFGSDALDQVLVKGGFDPQKSSAILWEGVTYYLPMEAIEITLSQIRDLLNAGETVSDTETRDYSSTEMSDVSPASEVEVGLDHGDAGFQKPTHSLLLDFMDTANTVNMKESWLWNLEQKLSTAIGTPFITGVDNIEKLLAKYSFSIVSKVTREDGEKRLRELPYAAVLFEAANSTQGHNEPNLVITLSKFRDAASL